MEDQTLIEFLKCMSLAFTEGIIEIDGIKFDMSMLNREMVQELDEMKEKLN